MYIPTNHIPKETNIPGEPVFGWKDSLVWRDVGGDERLGLLGKFLDLNGTLTPMNGQKYMGFSGVISPHLQIFTTGRGLTYNSRVISPQFPLIFGYS